MMQTTYTYMMEQLLLLKQFRKLKKLIKNNGAIVIWPDGQIETKLPDNIDLLHVYSGSFNPIHDGHLEIFDSIKILNNRGLKVFEISLERDGKYKYGYAHLLKIISQFSWKYPLILTDSKTFFKKKLAIQNISKRNMKFHFHVGYDTAERILKAFNTDDSPPVINCRYIVYPRTNKNFSDLEGNIPNIFIEGHLNSRDHLFLSSSKIRENLKNGSN